MYQQTRSRFGQFRETRKAARHIGDAVTVCIEPLERRCLLSGGALDPSFGNSGVLAGYAGPIKVEADGKIVVDQGGTGKLVRLNPDGLVDKTFNSKGVVDDWRPGVARQKDGKLLAIGNDDVLRRYNSNGSLDKSFATGGEVSSWSTNITGFLGNAAPDVFTYQPNLFEPSDIALQPDGRIVVSGDVSGNVPNGRIAAVERLLPNGKPDTSFGLAIIDLDDGDFSTTSRVRLTPDGYIVTAINTGGDSAELGYVSADGRSGGFSDAYDAGPSFANDLAVAPNGTVYLIGETQRIGSIPSIGFISEFSGVPASSVSGASSITTFAFATGDEGGPDTSFRSVAVGPDGRVLVAGSGGDDPTETPYLFRFRPGTPAGSGSLSVHLFIDRNGNGKLDKGESPIRYGQVFVDLNENGAFDAGEPTAFADFNGYYKIYGVLPGTYQVREVVPSGYQQTHSLGQTSKGYYVVTLKAGQLVGLRDFGNRIVPSKR